MRHSPSHHNIAAGAALKVKVNSDAVNGKVMVNDRYMDIEVVGVVDIGWRNWVSVGMKRMRCLWY